MNKQQIPSIPKFSLTHRRGSIANRILFLILLFSSFITLVITVYQLYSDYREQTEMVEQRMAQIELSYGESLANAIWFLDTKQIESILAGVMKFEDVHYVGVQIRDGDPLHLGAQRNSGSLRIHDVEVMHTADDRVINVGHLTIESNLDGVISRLGKKSWLILISQAFKTFCVSFFILFIIYYLVTRHLSEISRFATSLDIEEKEKFLKLDRKEDYESDELGQITQAMNQMKQGLIDDVAERERTEIKLRTLWQSVEQSSASVLILDADGKIEYANSRFEQSTGNKAEDVIGKKSNALCFGQMKDEDYKKIWQSITSGKEWRGEVHSQRKDGSWFWEAASVSSVTGSDGEITHYLILKDDISELRKLKENLELERDYLREEVITRGNFGEIIGDSKALKRTLAQVESVAGTSATVLILGASGVGKEMIARAIHAQSNRADKPMVKVNCASVPHELFESEFFGHVQGSFTGAHKDRIGRLQLADGGTLFLDEIAEIPISQQGKLLRALQENEFERIGDNKTIRVNVRVVAATNRDLQEEIKAGRFREDLFYRLSVFPIEVPTLRDRIDDVVPLALNFLEKACKELGRKPLELNRSQAAGLQQHDWPGNIRELKNTIERAVISSTGDKLILDVDLIGISTSIEVVSDHSNVSSAGYITNDEFRELEKANIVAALKEANWKTWGDDGAAALLGVKPTTLAYQIKTFGIEKPS